MRRIFVVLMVATAGILGAAEYYRSNAIGMLLEAISPFRIDEFEYVMELDRKTNGDTRILLQNGREIGRWETRVADDILEELYFQDTLISKTIYSGDLIISEILFADGIADRRIDFTYDNSRLIKKKVYDGDDTLLYEDSYIRRGSGRLKSVIRSTDGITETLSFGYVSDQLTEDWYNDGDSGFLRKYRGENLSARLEWEDGADIRRTEYFLEENPERTTEYDLISGRIRMRWFSAEGDVIREKYSGEGIPDEEIVSVYAEGNLVNRKRITQEQFEEWQYTYSDEGALTEEWFVRNGSPVKTTYYDSETEYREELYRAGEVFLVVYFVDDRRIAEKFLMQEDDETTAED